MHTFETTYDMVDYLEKEGYHIFYEGNLYDGLNSDKMITELKDRGHYYRDMDDSTFKEEAESRGFFISERDERKELLEDIYRHATWMHNGQMQSYLNDLFVKYLKKWI